MEPCWQRGAEAVGNGVAWPWLGVRKWGEGSNHHPPCYGGGWWVPGEPSRHRDTDPCAPSGRSETGVAEQGTLLSCAPFPSSCYPRIPVSGHCLTAGCCSDSRATCWGAGREAGAQRPGHSCQGGLSLLHREETLFHTGKKNTGPAARHHGGPAGLQC